MAKYNENKSNKLTILSSLNRLTSADLNALWDFALNDASSQFADRAKKLIKDPEVAKFQLEVEQFVVRRQIRQNKSVMLTRGFDSLAENRVSEQNTKQSIVKTQPTTISAILIPEQLAKRNDQEIQSLSGKDTKTETIKENYNVNILNKSTTMKKKFSLWREINNASNLKSPDDVAAYYLEEGEKINNETGISYSNGNHKHLYLPLSARSAVLASQIGGVESDLPLPSIQNYIEVVSLGARFYESFGPLKRIPVFGEVTAQTAGEGDSITEGTGTLNTLNLASNRISYSQPIPKLLLSLPAFGDIFIQNAMAGIGKKLMDIICGVGARTATYGQSIGYKCTTGLLTKKAAVVPTHNIIESLVGELVDAGTLTGKLAFVTSGKGRMILRSIERETGSGGKFLLEDGKVSEYPCHISNSVSNIAGSDGNGALFIFGNWQDLLINQTGVWDICIDNVTQARSHKVVITVTGHFDALGARGSLATSPFSETDADEFAKSFATLPIKFA